MKSAEEFLRTILPSKGRYCVATFYSNRKGAHHTWCNSIEELAKTIELRDAGCEAVYHACASYGDLRNKKGKIERSKANVQFLRALYCEVDIRDGEKGYDTPTEALAALKTYIQTANFPTPTIVNSGGGYHFYWPINRDLTRDEWEIYARGLKIHTAKAGFKVDVGITADAARILRTPGTSNRKYENTLVTLEYASDVFDLSRFSVLRMQQPTPVSVAGVYEKTIYDTDLIVSKCNQLSILRDNPTEQDGLTWIACARVLSETKDGEQFFHEHSSKDPRYNADEAAKKWAESVKHGKAVTCQYFESINPSGCEGCAFRGKIKTPLHIGRSSNFKLPPEVADVLKFADMPMGFRFDENGRLMYVTEKQNDAGETEEKCVYIHQFPVLVEDRYISEVTGEDYRLGLKHWQPHDGWRTVHVDASDFLRNTEAAFGGKGIFSEDDKLLKRYVKQSLNMIANKRASSMSYETMGWKVEEDKKSFLLGNKLFSGVKAADGSVTVKSETVALTEGLARIANSIGPGGKYKKGSWDNQQKAQQQLTAPGHEWQLATVVAAHAAILMPLVLQSEGGLVWSTYDYKGGAGKTLAATAAATVWGDFEALVTTSSDTPKSRVAALGMIRHLPQIFDEMKRTDPQLAREFVQVFTSGKEGTRLVQTGDFSKHQRNWCTVLITSSNQELAGAIEAAEGSKAMLSRIFEVEAKPLPLSKGEYKESFKHVFLNNPGFSGEKFVKCVVLLETTGELYTMIDQADAQLTQAYSFDAHQRFKLAFFICMYVTSHIMNEAGLMSFSPERLMSWLLDDSNVGWKDNNRIEMTDILALYLQEKIRNTLVVPSEFVRKPLMVNKAPSDELTIRIEDTGNIFLAKNQLAKWLQTKDISLKHFTDELERIGALKSGNAKRSLGAGTVFGVGQSWCLIIEGRHEDIVNVMSEDNVIDLETKKKQLQLNSTPS